MNKKDFKEFVGFVAEQFSRIEKQFSRVAEQFSRVEEQFSVVIGKIDHLEETKADKADVQRIVAEVVGKKTDEILSTMDRYAKESSDQKQEHDMLVGQVNRHDKWINKIALKTDTKLDY